jgi:transcriptional regulator with XRE-family HTH domain
MTTASLGTGVGPLLRGWRERRRLSQLELALRADSSARHVSFIETGRSRPSEAMLLRLAEHLEIPVRDRNALFLAAGYAPRYTETPLEDPAMGALREGIEQLLRGYEPYPALVVDGCYNVLAANQGILMLLEGLPERLLTPPLNAMRLTLHPQGMASRIRNLAQWRGHLLAQMERQIAHLRSESLRALYEEVAAYPVAPTDPTDPGDPGDEAEGPTPHPYFALPLRIEHDGQVLSFVSSISTFNTPMDVTVSELAVEAFLPADAETGAYLRSLQPSPTVWPSVRGGAQRQVLERGEPGDGEGLRRDPHGPGGAGVEEGKQRDEARRRPGEVGLDHALHGGDRGPFPGREGAHPGTEQHQERPEPEQQPGVDPEQPPERAGGGEVGHAVAGGDDGVEGEEAAQQGDGLAAAAEGRDEGRGHG